MNVSNSEYFDLALSGVILGKGQPGAFFPAVATKRFRHEVDVKPDFYAKIVDSETKSKIDISNSRKRYI